MEKEVALAAHRVARRFMEWRQLTEGEGVNMQRVGQAWQALTFADKTFRDLVGDLAERPGGCGCPDDEDT